MTKINYVGHSCCSDRGIMHGAGQASMTWSGGWWEPEVMLTISVSVTSGQDGLTTYRQQGYIWINA